MKRILVTGAGGFIGSNLVKYLLKDKTTRVMGLDNNPRIINDKLEIFNLDVQDIKKIPFKPDIIYHLAAQSRVQPSFDDPKSSTEDNVMGTLAVLEYAKKNKCEVVYAGSASRHFDHASSPYATTKYMGETLCKMYRKCFGVEVEIARFYNVYGPNEYLHPTESNVIGIWRYNIENNITCSIVGDGDQERDFIHVEDIVEGLVAIGEGVSNHDDAWELGTGKTTSVNDLATMFHERFENKYNFIDDQMGNVRKSMLINNDAYERLGWNPQRNLVDYIISL
jgi:UDP-glucose 4-epimerase